MKLDWYELKSDDQLTTFTFLSEGPKGKIEKLIQFSLVNQNGLYNLAIGNKNSETGEIDDLSVSNNGDTDKVLATVVASLYAFFEYHPDAYVYATGSTLARTRLYRVGITRFFEEMEQDFYLYGQTKDGLTKFEAGKEYVGFLAQRKFT